MAGGSWSCPHEVDGLCSKVNNLPCDPGMKGCVLAGRYFFFNDDKKNERLRNKRAREAAVDTATVTATDTAAETETETAVEAAPQHRPADDHE